MAADVWLRPLRARFPNPDETDVIVAPAYDSMSPQERFRHAMEHPRSFMNVVLSRRDFPPPARSAVDVASRAKEHLAAMVAAGDYGPEQLPGVYVYRMTHPTHTQTGVVGGLPISLVRERLIRGHEATIPERSDDIAVFFEITGVNASPVSMTATLPPGFAVRLEAATHHDPMVDFEAEDGVRHQLWSLVNDAVIGELNLMLRDAGVLYVTDGHHRMEASQVDADRSGVDTPLLGVVFPADEVQVLAYNRAVRITGDPAELPWDALSDRYDVHDIGDVGDEVETRAGTFLVLAAGRWTRLTRRGARPEDPVEALDVSVLHREVLPILGVETDDDTRLRYVVGHGGPARMALECEEDDVGFVMHDPSIEELVAVADVGRHMPAKSTYFYPKVRSGVIYVER